MRARHTVTTGIGLGVLGALLFLSSPGQRARVFAGGRGTATAPDTGAVKRAGDPEPVAARLAVSGEVVSREPFVLRVRGSGRAESLRRAELACRVGEQVVDVHVREGEHVRAGQTLVRLDPRPFEIALREAEARLASARIEFATQDDSTSGEERRRGVAARTGLTEAEQRVERARLDLEGTRIVAPFEGDVVSVQATVGERAQPERPLVTLVDRQRLRVPAEVLESSFAALAIGSRARVLVPALPGRAFAGTIAALGPEIDPTRGTGIAYVELEDAGGVQPGMYCEVDLDARRLDGRLSVARAAVLERSRRLLVFVARGGRADWSYVETGLENDDRIEIVSGVAPGDTVLVDGHLTLAHGAPVRVELGRPAEPLP